MSPNITVSANSKQKQLIISHPGLNEKPALTLQDDCVHCKNLNSEGKDKMSKNKISKKQ